GYKDNMTHALPLLRKYGLPATIFLEAEAVDRRGLTWIHKFFFLRRYKGSRHIASEYIRMTQDAKLAQQLRAALSGPEESLEYTVKRLLKYDADAGDRGRLFDTMFRAAGGNEQELLDNAYLSWDDVRAMAGQGISFGCHTLSHPILSSLTRDEARHEISGARRLIREKAGIDAGTFAYPWGRVWDFTSETVELLKEEGFLCAMIMDDASLFPGCCDFFRLSRYPVLSDLNLADILAQASGLYGWFGRRLGV
ncbi:MAG: polysaccharide deacetylase family protein, partial [Planctomycetota bacterium]